LGRIEPLPLAWSGDRFRREAVATGPPTKVASPTDSGRSDLPAGTGLHVKGFGCRPIRNLTAGTEGRRPKASREGPRGGQRGGCRLWRFDGRAASASDALVCEGDRG